MARLLFSKAIDVILEDTEFFVPASEALRKLADAQKVVKEAEQDLQEQIETLHNRLALEIRRENPALNVIMGRDGACTVRYRQFGNALRFNADPETQNFSCGATAFERRFRRYHGHTLDLGVSALGEAVAKFFKQNYRSIR
jgi:hypothetical protein